ncbi:MAG: flavodoxin family protein [Anaerolineales bacterium]|nr:flavodoxin family protein [Anaerolineales bacterium]
MQALVVYFSKFGNTHKVAEVIGAEFRTRGEARVINLNELAADDLRGVDLLVIGTPTHRMNLPEVVRPIFEELPKRALRGAPVAAFDTSYKMSKCLMPFTAAKKLVGKLRKLGGKKIIAPETFFVEDRQGPLYPGELERAKTWAKLVMRRAGLG